jgi:hypothetical protein
MFFDMGLEGTGGPGWLSRVFRGPSRGLVIKKKTIGGKPNENGQTKRRTHIKTLSRSKWISVSKLFSCVFAQGQRRIEQQYAVLTQRV